MIFLVVEIHIFSKLEGHKFGEKLGNCYLINSFGVNILITI